MYLQKVLSRKSCVTKLVFCWHLQVNDENSRIRIQDPDSDPLVRGMDPRIRIHWSEAWIHGIGSGSTPKCHGSAKLLNMNSESKNETK
jgi:hypothetical protein